MDKYQIIQQKIQQLKAEREVQEFAIQAATQSLLEDYKPVNFAKNAIMELADDRNVQTDVTKLGVNLGVGLLTNKLVAKQKGLKGVLMTLIISKLANVVIENGTPYILAAVSHFLEGQDEYLTDEESE